MSKTVCACCGTNQRNNHPQWCPMPDVYVRDDSTETNPMTTPPNSEPPNEPPSREAVEAALLYALPRTTPYKSDAEIQARNNASDYLYDIHPRGNSYQSAARILAAEVQRLAVDLGSAQDKLDQIKALCEGHGVGLRDYVLDILKQP